MQGVDLLTDGIVIVRRNSQSADFLGHQLVDGLQLSVQVVLCLSDQDGTVVAFQFLRLVADTGQDIIIENGIPSQQNNAQLQIFLLGGENDAGFVGLIVQRLNDFQYFSFCLRVDGAAVVQHPVHRAAGYAGQVGDFFERCHNGNPFRIRLRIQRSITG